MQRIIGFSLVLALLFVLSGCYHATVVTGEEPSAQTIEQPWATSFIGGLVPPSTVDAAQQCPDGVAQVETRLSFLNQIVTGITFGLYSPMEIKVTCAAGGSAHLMTPELDIDPVDIPADAPDIKVAQSVQEAAWESAQTGEAVTVQISE